jgi:hypothetical protein
MMPDRDLVENVNKDLDGRIGNRFPRRAACRAVQAVRGSVSSDELQRNMKPDRDLFENLNKDLDGRIGVIGQPQAVQESYTALGSYKR